MTRIMAWLESRGQLFAISSIALATLIFLPGRPYFAKGQWALLYLPIIVLVASVAGVRPALSASVLSFFTWDFFFLPPYFTLNVSDPKDWLALLVFLAVGISMGLQTARMKRRESQALARERESTAINRIGSHLVTQTELSNMSRFTVAEISNALNQAPTALFLTSEPSELHCVALSDQHEQPSNNVAELCQWAYSQAKAIGLPAAKHNSFLKNVVWPISVSHADTGLSVIPDSIVIPLQGSSRVEGVLFVGPKSDNSLFTQYDAAMLVSIANQIATFLERSRLQQLANQSIALKEADRLKSAFISSVSHELKTPLASLTATITGILEDDYQWDDDAVRAELHAVKDDLRRLNASIGSLLDLSRLEADSWSTNRESYELGEILSSIISCIPARMRNRIVFDIPDNMPLIRVDFRQWSLAIQNLIENALIYSPPEQPVKIQAYADLSNIRITIQDSGPGIPPDERELIFQKFFRGKASGSAPTGTGLGLAIVREIVRNHNGRVWVEDAHPRGARFVLSLAREQSNDC